MGSGVPVNVRSWIATDRACRNTRSPKDVWGWSSSWCGGEHPLYYYDNNNNEEFHWWSHRRPPHPADGPPTPHEKASGETRPVRGACHPSPLQGVLRRRLQLPPPSPPPRLFLFRLLPWWSWPLRCDAFSPKGASVRRRGPKRTRRTSGGGWHTAAGKAIREGPVRRFASGWGRRERRKKKKEGGGSVDSANRGGTDDERPLRSSPPVAKCRGGRPREKEAAW